VLRFPRMTTCNNHLSTDWSFTGFLSEKTLNMF
jgi:hypothetical protein